MTDITTPITEQLLRGAVELEHTEHGLQPHRLPARARAQAGDPQLAMAEAQPAGVRLALRTRACRIELHVLRTKLAYQGGPARPDGVYELLVDGEPAGSHRSRGGNLLTVDVTTGQAETTPGPVEAVRFEDLPCRDKDVEIWLPHNELTRLVALRTDAPVEPLPLRRPVWVHHGSSISHGSNATRPTATWPVVAARRAGVEPVNLGLSGSALLDGFTARAIAAMPAQVISLKLGINLVNADLMRRRGFTAAVHNFLDLVRDGHPDTPLLVISPIHCPLHEDTPGPAGVEFTGGQVRFTATGDPREAAAGKLTLRVIRDELARLCAERAAEDPHLHHLDGRELYGAADAAELPLPDALHPDEAAHRRIGERFAALAFGPGGPLAR